MANNHPILNQPSPMPVARAGGISGSRGSNPSKPTSTDQSVIPFGVKWAKELSWAEQHLPDEHPGFVAVAIQTMKRSGVPVTTKSVLAHLVASGRDRKATDALAAKYERKAAA